MKMVQGRHLSHNNEGEGFVQEIVVEVRERSAEMSEKEEICGGTRQKMLKSERSIEGGHKAGAGVVVCYDEGG
ncbi:hypothetical protein CRG98_050456 [Punica granatum]|uniref:Uncharacterized protein n=1 Tax=Punica granatum TaxID=22663 RepID=A0A2I0GBH3_PUNGR|nr:hypothetical protein CRG98_050456 [Punica granatum]